MDNFLKESFASGNVQLFVGSGMSSGLYPDAQALLDKLLDDTVYSDGTQTTVRALLGEPSTFSLDDVAEFYELYHGTPALLDVIKNTYGQHRPSTEAHKNLWKLPHVRWIYTTNFDCLVEDAITRPKEAAEIVTRGKDIKLISARQRVVFKPHGCARRSSSRQ